MSPDGRFAPSPTGPLHLGSLRTALLASLGLALGRDRVHRAEDLLADFHPARIPAGPVVIT